MRRSHSDAGHGRDGAHDVGEGSPAQVAPVGGDVLADEHDLASAESRRARSVLGEDIGAAACSRRARGSTGSCSTRRRDGSRPRCAGTPRAPRRSRSARAARTRLAYARDALERGEERGLLGDRQECGDLGDLGGEVGSVARGHAACDHDRPALALRQPLGGHLEDCVDRLLRGFLDERAGVDDTMSAPMRVLGKA